MKFSQNGLYIERYLKCVNCGVLIYEGEAGEKGARELNGDLFCSAWCVDWARLRQARRTQAGPVDQVASRD